MKENLCVRWNEYFVCDSEETSNPGDGFRGYQRECQYYEETPGSCAAIFLPCKHWKDMELCTHELAQEEAAVLAKLEEM